MPTQVPSVQWTSVRTHNRALSTHPGRILIHQYDLLPAEADSFCAAIREAATTAADEAIARPEAVSLPPNADSVLDAPLPAFQRRRVVRWFLPGETDPVAELSDGNLDLKIASVSPAQVREFAEILRAVEIVTGRAVIA